MFVARSKMNVIIDVPGFLFIPNTIPKSMLCGNFIETSVMLLRNICYNTNVKLPFHQYYSTFARMK